MMRIRVAFSSQLARQAGVSEQVLDLPEDATVKLAIRHLAEQHGKDFASLVGGSDLSHVRTALLVAVDGEQTRDLDQTVLNNGSELVLLMPMSGG